MLFYNTVSLFAGVSSTLNVLIWIAIAIVALGILMIPVSYFVASYCVYTATLKRKSPEHWNYDPEKLNENYLSMDAEGMKWQREHADAKTDVHIVNGGLELYGEYYDLGSKRCMIFLPGRTESLRYGYYFSKPYSDMGWNVLLIDPRAHGRSGGEFNTAGFEESGDILAWARFIHDEFGIESIVFHGICIGAAGAILALTSEDCPDYIDGMVGEGMFPNFGDILINHLIERKKPVHGIYALVNMWMKHYTGHSIKYGPIDVADKLRKPILMLHSKEDIYSLPARAQEIYDKVPDGPKKIVWFERGSHSMLRLTDTEKYDTAVKAFLENTIMSNIQ